MLRVNALFTERAKMLLDQEGKRLVHELKEAAISESLLSRGEPVEVTESDVRKARDLVGVRPSLNRPSRLTRILLLAYAAMGAGALLAGIVSLSVRLFSTVSLGAPGIDLVLITGGVAMIGLSLGVRALLRSRTRSRKKCSLR